jgi:hypothetical protein
MLTEPSLMATVMSTVRESRLTTCRAVAVASRYPARAKAFASLVVAADSSPSLKGAPRLRPRVARAAGSPNEAAPVTTTSPSVNWGPSSIATVNVARAVSIWRVAATRTAR